MKGVDQSAYYQDLAECQVYANQISPVNEAAGGALIGAGAGALVGAVLGAFLGDAGYGAGIGAAYGGTTGLIGGGYDAAVDQQSVVARCLSGRDYRVLR